MKILGHSDGNLNGGVLNCIFRRHDYSAKLFQNTLLQVPINGHQHRKPDAEKCDVPRRHMYVFGNKGIAAMGYFLPLPSNS